MKGKINVGACGFRTNKTEYAQTLRVEVQRRELKKRIDFKAFYRAAPACGCAEPSNKKRY